MTTLAGIDVSNLQGPAFNWPAERGHIAFAGIKISEGTGFEDADAARNVAQARANGIVPMGYHYLHPSQSGSAQAAYFVILARKAGIGPGDLVMLDNETNDGSLSAAQVADCAALFAHVVHQDFGAWPVAYADQDYAEHGYCAGLGMCPAFIANPSHVVLPSPIGPWGLVSFEQTGQRGVDTDVFYGDLAQLGKLAIPHPAAPPPKPPVPVVTRAEYTAAMAVLLRAGAELPA